MFNNKLFFLAVLLLSFTACTEETFDPVLTIGDAPAITTPAGGDAFVLTEETADDEFAAFSWSPADFGINTQVNYTLEVDVAGNGFADAEAVVPTTNATSASVSNNAINSVLTNRGLPGGVAQDMEARIKAVVGIEDDGNVLFSSPVTFSVTPFEAEVIYPSLFVPGAHQGWDPASAPNIYSVPDDGNYDGYVYFADDNNEFKFTDAPNWDNGNFGDDDGDGNIDSGGGNIMAGAAGLYRLTVNINDMTYTSTRTEWGLIGSATPGGWDADTDMTYDPATGIYSLTVDLVAGEIKFRANDAWDIDLGDTGADLKMEYGGDNIAIAEDGNYTIELLLNRAVYSYSVVKN